MGWSPIGPPATVSRRTPMSRNAIAPVAGLIQRVIVIVGWSWLSLLALHQARDERVRSLGIESG